MELDASIWQTQLHAAFPAARRIGLWDANGAELTWSELGGSSGGAPHAGAGNLTVYAVLDEFPFVWPASMGEAPRLVQLGDDRPVALRLLSERPRVLVADDMFTAAECEAVCRLARPKMSESTQIVGGVTSVVATARNSDTAWIPRVDRTAVAEGGDEAMVSRVQVRQRCAI